MAIIIPQPVKTFPGGAGLPVLNALTFMEPKEGKRYIPVDIVWPAGGMTYDVNVNGITTQPFSQIVMLDVDNNQCGVDVQFIFPDSGDTLIIPGASGGLFPVFTNSTKFYVSAIGALATDVTRFRILNYRQEPVALPPPQYNQIASQLGLSAVGTFPILAAGVSGTLSGYDGNLSIFFAGGGAGQATLALKDRATSAIIAQGAVTASNNSGSSAIVFNTDGTAIRFAGGLDAVVAIGAGVSSVSGNIVVRYRRP